MARDPETASSGTNPTRVIILADGRRSEVREQVSRLTSSIEAFFTITAIDFEFAASIDTTNADLAIVFGGDGSILRAAHQMAYQQLPVLGVNLGKLGFLADVLPDQLVATLPQLAAGKFRVVDHLMFQCQLIRDGETLRDQLGLNEAAVLAGPPFAILDVELYVDGELVTTYSADGLIVSTPVGSTAHTLSAGGPILRKNLQAFVIAPISPHTLTNRPVVDAAHRVYELSIPQPHPGTSLVVDGEIVATLSATDRVRITRSDAIFQLVEVPGQGYYRTLREKLGWGGSLSH